MRKKELNFNLGKLTLEIWKKGGPVGIEQFKSYIEVGKLYTVEEFCEEMVLMSNLKPVVMCLSCGHQLKNFRQDRYLICTCGTRIDTLETTNLDMFRFIPDFDRIAESVSTELISLGVTISKESKELDIEYLRDLGMLKRNDEINLRLLVSTKSLEQRTVSELWGNLQLRKERGIVIYPGLSKESEILISTTAASIPILFLNYQSFPKANFIEQLHQFQFFRDDVEKRLRELNILFEGVFAVKSDAILTGLPENLDYLSKRGGESFESPAIKLLNTIGAPLELTKRPYLPDGILLLPKGFWIIDAKSSLYGFKFNVDERDKASRYVRTIEENNTYSGPGWKFFGEIILTGTENITSETIRKVKGYFSGAKLDSSIVILSYEGLKWLWESSINDPTYWHLFNGLSDPEILMDLNSVIYNKLEDDDISKTSFDNHFRVISENAMKVFWDYVFDRGTYVNMLGHTPQNVADFVQSAFMTAFSGPRI